MARVTFEKDDAQATIQTVFDLATAYRQLLGDDSAESTLVKMRANSKETREWVGREHDDDVEVLNELVSDLRETYVEAFGEAPIIEGLSDPEPETEGDGEPEGDGDTGEPESESGEQPEAGESQEAPEPAIA